MKIAVAGDSAGKPLVDLLVAYLASCKGIEVADLSQAPAGAAEYYAGVAERVACAVMNREFDRGILCCGTGIGMSIAANKVPGIRAALVTDTFMARMAKEHNNANVLVLGGRVMDGQKGCELVGAWLDAEFEGGRHQSRLDKITEIEKKYS